MNGISLEFSQQGNEELRDGRDKIYLRARFGANEEDGNLREGEGGDPTEKDF